MGKKAKSKTTKLARYNNAWLADEWRTMAEARLFPGGRHNGSRDKIRRVAAAIAAAKINWAEHYRNAKPISVYRTQVPGVGKQTRIDLDRILEKALGLTCQRPAPRPSPRLKYFGDSGRRGNGWQNRYPQTI